MTGIEENWFFFVNKLVNKRIGQNKKLKKNFKVRFLEQKAKREVWFPLNNAIFEEKSLIWCKSSKSALFNNLVGAKEIKINWT